MGGALNLVRLLDLEPHPVVVELHRNGAVLLSQADQCGLAQVLVVEPDQLRRIVSVAERMVRDRVKRRRPEVAT